MTARKLPRVLPSLAGKTLAEDNLKGFKIKDSKKKENEIPLKINYPQRIELPVYFNTPRRKDDYMNYKKYRSKYLSIYLQIFIIVWIELLMGKRSLLLITPVL